MLCIHGLPAIDLLDLLDRLQRAVGRGGVGQLDLGHEGALVLVGQEARRHQAADAAGRQHEAADQHQREEAAPRDRRHQPDVAVAALVDAVLQPGHDAARLAAMAQDQRAQRGRQRQGVDGRDHHRHRHRDRELAVELAGDAGDEGRRDEHREQHQGDGDDRRGDLAHRLLGRLGGRELGLVLEDVLDRLDHDDGVVDHDADRQHQRQQRDGVGRDSPAPA